MISIYGGINLLSYGIVTTNLVNALCNLNKQIQLYPINPHNVECESKYQENIKKSLDNAKFFTGDCPCIKIWHQWDYSIFPNNNLRCGFPIFELSKLTQLEVWNLNSLDKVFVTSKWAKDVCIKSGVITEINIVPLGIDSEVFFSKNRVKKNKTVYINIGKFEKRKGHAILAECFNKAFQEKDNVELWMMTNNCFLDEKSTKEWESLYKNSKLSSKIKFLPRQQTQNQVKYLIDNADFIISPSFAEGWNLPVLEAMACGTVPITTNYSAMTEYCSNKNSFLIEPTELEFAEDGCWFKNGNSINNGEWLKWTKSQEDQFIEHLRASHKINMEQSSFLKELQQECLQTAKQFTWKNSAQIILNHLSILS